MTELSSLLGRRTVARSGQMLHRRRRPDAPLTLGHLRPPERARVRALDPRLDDATARRLVDLGFHPGTEVEVVRCAPFRGPMIFRVAEYELAIRRELAERVEVLPVQDRR